MSFTAWDRSLRVTQGRITPAGWTPPEGTHVFVLGSDVPRDTERLNGGDFVEVFQTGSFSTAHVLRLKARIRPPSVAPPMGFSWRASFRIDDVEIVGKAITRLRTLLDIGTNVAHLTGAHKVSFRLTLVGSGTADVELPAFYVDALMFDATTARPLLVNRDPEPNETNVPASTTVAIDVFDVGANGIDLSHTTITIDGVVAVLNGAAQTGYTLVSSNPAADVLRLVVTLGTPFVGSERAVPVRVQTRTLVDFVALDQSYSFTTARTVGPQLASVLATGQKTIRVTWQTPVLQASPAGADDALVVGNYALARLPDQVDADGYPRAVAQVTPIAVVSVSASSVDLSTDIEMTPGASYALTVSNVEDLFGNISAGPTNTLTFPGFAPAVPSDRDWNLYRMVPQKNRDEDTSLDLARFLSIFQELCDLALVDLDAFADLIDPDVAPMPYVEQMLLDLGNPFDFELSDTDKRRLVQILVAIYGQKGTEPGIINAIRFFMGITVTCTNLGSDGWILGSSLLGFDTVLGTSDAYLRNSFEVNVAQTLTAAQLAQMTQLATYMKANWTHLARILQPFTPPAYDPMELGISRLGVDWILH